MLMLSNFPNWGSGVTFPVVPISCFTGDYYCCSGHLVNARFLAKNWDPGESILLMPRVSVLQVALKMALELGNHFQLACSGLGDVHLDPGLQCSGLLDVGYESQQFGPQSTLSLTTRKRLRFHGQQIHTSIFSSLRQDILFTVFLYSFFSVICQLGFRIAFLKDNGT